MGTDLWTVRTSNREMILRYVIPYSILMGKQSIRKIPNLDNISFLDTAPPPLPPRQPRGRGGTPPPVVTPPSRGSKPTPPVRGSGHVNAARSAADLEETEVERIARLQGER